MKAASEPQGSKEKRGGFLKDRQDKKNLLIAPPSAAPLSLREQINLASAAAAKKKADLSEETQSKRLAFMTEVEIFLLQAILTS